MYEPFTTGRLLRRSFSTLGSGFVPFVTLALIVESPIPAWRFLSPRMPIEPLLVEPIAVFLSLPLSAVASAALVYGVFQSLRGEPVTIGRCFQIAASRWLAVLGLSLLTALAAGLGTVACVIPGIVISCGLFVGAPALIVEKSGVIEAMRRSWSLTDGHKVTIFFFSLGLGLIQVAVIGIPSFLLASLLTSASAENAPQLTTLFVLWNYLVTAVSMAVSAVATTIAYHDLRVFREDLGTEELAAVFD
ncbi:MAG: hypothetical protein GY856_10310 [bacterium]|nr:hypothetical protein [bacterium]